VSVCCEVVTVCPRSRPTALAAATLARAERAANSNWQVLWTWTSIVGKERPRPEAPLAPSRGPSTPFQKAACTAARQRRPCRHVPHSGGLSGKPAGGRRRGERGWEGRMSVACIFARPSRHMANHTTTAESTSPRSNDDWRSAPEKLLVKTPTKGASREDGRGAVRIAPLHLGTVERPLVPC
jgi:hypothetical protein